MNSRIHITVMKLAPGREQWLHTHTGPRWAHRAVHGKQRWVFPERFRNMFREHGKTHRWWKVLDNLQLSIWRNRFETISLSQYFTLNVWFFVPTQHVNSSPAMGDSTRIPRLLRVGPNRISSQFPVSRRSQDWFSRQKIERFFWRDFSGEIFLEQHYCPYNFVPTNLLWSGFIFPELEHL